MQATLEEAYQAACAELGAALVQQRLLAQEVARLTAENAAPRPESAVEHSDEHLARLADRDV